MSRLTRYLGRRTLNRMGGWGLAAGLLILLLYGAGRMLPVHGYWGVRGPRLSVPPQVASGLVSGVADGDTLFLEGGITVRLKDLDTPEKDQPGYAEAREALLRLVRGKRVRLTYGTGRFVDRYGRLLAYVHLPDDRCVNDLLLAGGWGWIYRPEEDRLPQLLRLQRAAMDGREGVWRFFRDREGPYTGNRASHIFHRPDTPCGRSVSMHNRHRFPRLSDAFREGYSPCRSCFTHPLEGRP